MRFNRFGKHEYRDTDRKRAAFRRKQVNEQRRYPLFAEEIAAAQIDVDTEMDGRKTSWAQQITRDRLRAAKKWREARAKLAAYPATERAELLAYWQRCGWPADPVYLLSMLHMYNNGKLELHPVVVKQTEANRIAVRLTIERLQAQAAQRKLAQAALTT